jgi:hypothetical protein
MQGSYEFHRQDLLLGALLDTQRGDLLLAVLGILAAFGIVVWCCETISD